MIEPATRTLLKRRWSTPAWLTCVLKFRGRRREVMATRSWTELFFLDEATALAAGHRPCFFCRREDANRFRAAWEQGNGVTSVHATDIDRALHAERLDHCKKRLHPRPMPLTALPDGTMVQQGADSYLIANGKTSLWSPAGYRAAEITGDDALLLTPPSTVRALAAGYRPVLHPSGGQKATADQ